MIERLMNRLGYYRKPKWEMSPKQADEFQSFILRALKEMTIREVAEMAQTSLPTVQRWASGRSRPVQSFLKHIIKHLEPEVLKREDELYIRLFGHKKPRETK